MDSVEAVEGLFICLRFSSDGIFGDKLDDEGDDVDESLLSVAIFLGMLFCMDGTGVALVPSLQLEISDRKSCPRFRSFSARIWALIDTLGPQGIVLCISNMQ